MSEKISGSTSTGGYPTYPGPATAGISPAGGRALSKPAPTGQSRGGDDAISLTDDAELLQMLDAQIAATPAVNAARVEEIRTAMANGDYQVDSERLAAKLLATEGGIEALLFRN